MRINQAKQEIEVVNDKQIHTFFFNNIPRSDIRIFYRSR
jgi:hypothetical protein